MILPFVFSLLLLLGLGSYALTSEMISLSAFSHVLKSAAKAEHGLQERSVKREFSERLPKKEESKEGKSSPKYSISREVHTVRRELSKLDIKPLFKNRDPDHFAVGARLIHLLYKGTLLEAEIEELFGVNYGEKILETLLKKERGSLEELLPEEPKERALLYKLLRGTSHYTSDGKGIAPLLDFVTLGTSGESPINFPRASPQLLAALFGEPATRAILQAELKKGEGKLRSLKREELEIILSDFPEVQQKYANCAKLIHFTTAIKGKKELIFIDHDAHIERRKPLQM